MTLLALLLWVEWAVWLCLMKQNLIEQAVAVVALKISVLHCLWTWHLWLLVLTHAAGGGGKRLGGTGLAVLLPVPRLLTDLLFWLMTNGKF